MTIEEDFAIILQSETTGISRNVIDALLRVHPFALKLTETGINRAVRVGFDFNEIIPELVKKQFLKEWHKKQYNRSVIDLVAGSIQYGAYCLTINQYDIDISTCLNKAELHKTDYFINAVPPLFTAGTFSKFKMPLYRGFMSEPVNVTVNGYQFHASRGKAFFNPFIKIKLFEYNQSTLGFTPQSSFLPILPHLISILKASDAFRSIIEKATMLIHKKQGGDVPSGYMPTTGDKLMGFINKLRATMFKLATGKSLVTINKDEDLSQINQQHTADTLKTSIEEIVNFISVGMQDGIPAHILHSEMLSSGLNEGGADLEKEFQWIENYQNAIQGLMDYLIEICFYACITPEFYFRFQLTNKDWQRKDRLVFIKWCIEKCEWSWNDLRKETKKDKLESAKQIVDIGLSIFEKATMAGFGKETLANLMGDIVCNANKTNVLAEPLTFNIATAIDELQQNEQQTEEPEPQNPLGSDTVKLSNLN
jgi:hypothetical protein